MEMIYVLGDACITQEGLKQLEAYGTVCVIKLGNASRQELAKKLCGATILISALFKLDQNFLSKLPALKCIILATTGCDDVDFEYARSRGIIVCYAPGYATEAVAEHTFALMLTSLRSVCLANQDVKNGFFDSCAYQGYELAGRRLGVIGFGRIGRRVAHIAEHGFGMLVSHYDQGMTQEEFNALLEASDVISLHVPLTKKTHHLIAREQFLRMKKGVVIINTARGGIIDEAALVEALRSGRVRAAGLDVLEHEQSYLSGELYLFSNVVITPHIAYNTQEAMDERSRIVVENVAAFLAGKPCNLACG